MEVASHAFARRQYRFASATGYFANGGEYRMSAYTLNAVMLHRIKNAAEPLIQMLSEEQKRAGMSVLQSMWVPF